MFQDPDLESSADAASIASRGRDRDLPHATKPADTEDGALAHVALEVVLEVLPN